MKMLQKQIWGKKTLGDVCSFKNGFNYNKGNLQTGLRVINVFDFKDNFSPDYDLLQQLVADKIPSEEYLLKKNDVVFVRSNGNKELIGRTLFIDKNPFPLTFSAFCIRARLIDPDLLPEYFVYYAKSDLFKENLRSLVRGTYISNISQSLLSNVTITIPPFDEQQRIVELFQSIEQSIQEVENQEKNLSALQQVLSNNLANQEPEFGNLLSEKNLTLYSFSDICDCIEQHEKTPLENGLSQFIGLENIETGNFTLQGFGNIEEGTTFTKRFSKGDVLFGKRRAYLKKVAVADFDGICSSDILVFRARDKVIMAELLPYYVSSDAFMNHAVSTSAGSLSPRTKWRDLANFELSIPDLGTQRKILDVLGQLSQSLQLIKQQKENLKKLKQKLLNEILG